MESDWSKITDGTAQNARFPPALRDDYFQVDERKFEATLARTAEFARYVPYYDLSNNKDQNWSALFADDEAIVMAEILATDAGRMETEFLTLLEDGSGPLSALRYLLRFARRIDSWRERLRGDETESRRILGSHIGAVVEKKLKGAIAKVLRQSRASKQIARLDSDILEKFSEIWDLQAAAKGESASGDPTAAHSGEGADYGEGEGWLLRTTFYSLVSAVSYLKPIADQHMQLSLSSGRHDPAMAMVITFAKLLGKVKDKANLFTQRHRDFYYGDVLRVVPRKQTPDSTLLVLEAAPGVAALQVPAGTDFTAGKAGGDVELIYRSESDLTVTDARVAALLTLYLPRDPFISPEHELGYVTAVRWGAALPDSKAQPADARPAEIKSWPLFGACKPEAQAAYGDDADVGFAIASAALLLREASRKVRVTVTFRMPQLPEVAGGAATPALGEQFRRLIFARGGDGDSAAFAAAVNAAFPTKERTVGDPSPGIKFEINSEVNNGLLYQDPLAIFFRVVGTAFRVGITVAGGWFETEGYALDSPGRSEASDRFQLVFEIALGPEAPPVAPYDPAAHGPGFNTLLPVLRFRLNPRATVYSYSLFDGLAVEEIVIDSEVAGATNVLAWNQFGQVDPSRPFQPFGPLPALNSYLILGHYESARMNLTKLILNVEWGGLPDVPGGFGEYYRDYQTPFADDQFVVDLGALRDGRWRPEPPRDDPAETLMFDSIEGRVGSRRSIAMNNVLRYFKRLEPGVPEDRFHYDQRAGNGFFRISLAKPETAFGHRDYPARVTGILSDNARAKWWGRHEPQPLPNAPYTPVVNRMWLDYRATSRITPGVDAAASSNLLGEKVYRLHPMGVEPVDTNRPWAMLPAFDYDGNLFIGFTATEPAGPLTLMFHLREDSATTLAPPAIPDVHPTNANAQRSTHLAFHFEPILWSYLASDRWMPLTGSSILSDTTDGFLSSGIVTLDLPAGMNMDNTILPGGLYWLRVSAKGNFQSFCSAYGVRMQALKVTRLPTGHAPFVKADPLPAGTIRKTAVSVPGLRSITQPLSSIGGREPESLPQMIARTSERLRHKARASTPWDYERLVLEAFPEVVKVKCFSAMTSQRTSQNDNFAEPGSVLVVVVPQQRESERGVVFDPMLDAFELKRIAEFLQPLTSTFVRIEVRNPAYERIQVRCRVKLTAAATRQRGTWLKKLNQTIVDYLSPWSPTGPTPRFGWSFRNDEVEAFIRKLDYVEFVTKFSMLHITRAEEGAYRLDDTARPGCADIEGSAGSPGSLKISPRYPWSLAIPTERHFIETFEETRVAIPPEKTGIGRMEIGSTFIVIA